MRLLLSAAAALALSLCALPASAESGDFAFYTPTQAEISGKPGTLIRAEPIDAPAGAASAFRILYRSTDFSGRTVPVSGVLIIPEGEMKAGGRPIVSWAPATSGVARQCARSLYPSVFSHIYGLQDWLSHGYVVVTTDYPGLGTPGGHSYLIGLSSGHAVLDAARAAQTFLPANAGKNVVLAGYSQGGHAVLHAGAQARSYAPGLNVVGVAASAPPTDLSELIREAGDGPIGRLFVTYAIASWSEQYRIPTDGVVLARVRKVFGHIARTCNLDFDQSLKMVFVGQSFEREGFLTTDITQEPRWKKLLAVNSAPLPPANLPVFIAQGGSDLLVRPGVTRVYENRLCAQGTRLTSTAIRGGHNDTGPGAASTMSSWIIDRLSGKPAPSDCGKIGSS